MRLRIRISVFALLSILVILVSTRADAQRYTVFGGVLVNPWHAITGRLSATYDEQGAAGVPVHIDAALMELCAPRPYECADVFARNGLSFWRGQTNITR